MTCCDLAYGEKKLTTARVTSENAIHESVDLVLISELLDGRENC
jgi:hypothetical protein